MFVPLLVADPSFTPTWEAFMKEWRDERELPQYIALAELARHLIARLESDATERFDAVFDVVERWHIEGDAYVSEAAAIGLIEDLQNTGLHRTTAPEAFLPWLRPASRQAWDDLEAFWNGEGPSKWTTHR
jgi:hypothetical protein